MTMRRALRLVATFLAFAAPLFAQAEKYWCPAEGVAYGVSLRKASEHIVHVDAVTHQPAADFALPVWNALYQVRDFAVNVQNVQAYEGVPEWLCDGCTTREATAHKLDKTTWRVESTAHHPCLTFSYDVIANDPGPFGMSLDAQHAFFNWAELLAYRPEKRDAPVTLRLLDVPAAWRLRDGGVFGGLTEDELFAQPTASAANYDRLVDAPALLGRLHEATFEQDGARYHIAVDSAEVDLQALQYMLRRITAAGVDWMQDRPYVDYSFLYLVAHGSGSGGMEHANSTAIDVSLERMKQDVTSAAGVSAHEYFHLWNVKRIRPRSLEPVDYSREQHTRALWFSEGVTSTAAEIILYRAGLSDEKRFLSRLASTIGSVEQRPAHRTQSAEESSLETWFDKYPEYHRPERSISYYPKGEILGFLIDLEMRRQTNGRRCLRDLMQYLNRRYAQPGLYFDDSEGIRLALEVLTGNDFRDFFSRYVSGTEDLPYERDFGYLGLVLTHRQTEQPYSGILATHTPGKPLTITRVEDGSPAAKVHLLSGDIIVEADGRAPQGDLHSILQRHDVRQPLRLKVSSNGQSRDVELTLVQRKSDEWLLEDAPNVTAEQRRRRTFFYRGESEDAAPAAKILLLSAPAQSANALDDASRSYLSGAAQAGGTQSGSAQ